MPRKLMPRINTPHHANGLVENLAAWTYLLHWMGSDCSQSIYRTEVECIGSLSDAVQGKRFVSWDQWSAVPEFYPERMLSRTAETSEGWSYWKERQREAGKSMPEAIASSLTKPFVYASINLIDLLLNRANAAVTVVSLQQSKPKAKRGRKLDAESLLVQLLNMHLHAGHRDGLSCPPFSNEEIKQSLGENAVSQPGVSRAMGELFRGFRKNTNIRPSKVYRVLCESGEIVSTLERIRDKRFDE